MKNTDDKQTEPTWTVYPFDYKGFKETELKYRLDHIFVSKDLNVHDFKVIQSKGSDHLPVLATVNIN